MRNNDYGSYEVLVQKDNKQRVNATLSISPNPEPVLLTQATLAGICVGAVLIFLALILLASYNSVYVRVYFKRYFGLHIIGEICLINGETDMIKSKRWISLKLIFF